MILTLLILLILPAFFIWYLLLYDAGEPERPLHLIEAFAFGLLAIAMVPLVREVVLWGLGLPNAMLQPTLVQVGGMVPASIVTVAGVEELLKFLPLALFIHGRRYFNEITDGVIYFALVGVCFGLIENIEYVMLAERSSAGSGLAVAVWRSVILLFLHAATTGMVGYFFARAKVLRRGLGPVIVALAAVIGLHALYDYGSFMTAINGRIVWFGLSVSVSLGVNLSLFVLLRRAWRLDQVTS